MAFSIGPSAVHAARGRHLGLHDCKSVVQPADNATIRHRQLQTYVAVVGSCARVKRVTSWVLQLSHSEDQSKMSIKPNSNLPNSTLAFESFSPFARFHIVAQSLSR